jgi:hypothetical protein
MFATTRAMKTRRNMPLDRGIAHFSANPLGVEVRLVDFLWISINRQRKSVRKNKTVSPISR